MTIFRICILIISFAMLLAIGIFGCNKEEAQKSDSSLEAPITTGYESALSAHPTKPIFRPTGTGPAVWGPGDLYTYLATGEETNNLFFQFEAVVPAGGGPPPHIHGREDESFYVVSGSLEMQLGDSILMAKAGDYVYIPRGTVHGFKNVGDSTAIQFVTVAPAGMEHYFNEVFPVVTDRNAAPPPPTEALIQKLIEVAPKYGLEFPPPTDSGKH